jgi:hypothetical protein
MPKRGNYDWDDIDSDDEPTVVEWSVPTKKPTTETVYPPPRKLDAKSELIWSSSSTSAADHSQSQLLRSEGADDSSYFTPNTFSVSLGPEDDEGSFHSIYAPVWDELLDKFIHLEAKKFQRTVIKGEQGEPGSLCID